MTPDLVLETPIRLHFFWVGVNFYPFPFPAFWMHFSAWKYAIGSTRQNKNSFRCGWHGRFSTKQSNLRWFGVTYILGQPRWKNSKGCWKGWQLSIMTCGGVGPHCGRRFQVGWRKNARKTAGLDCKNTVNQAWFTCNLGTGLSKYNRIMSYAGFPRRTC